jgi:hypothetical protein
MPVSTVGKRARPLLVPEQAEGGKGGPTAFVRTIEPGECLPPFRREGQAAGLFDQRQLNLNDECSKCSLYSVPDRSGCAHGVRDWCSDGSVLPVRDLNIPFDRLDGHSAVDGVSVVGVYNRTQPVPGCIVARLA